MRGRRSVAALALLALTACGSDPPRLRPVMRLVDEAHPATAIPLAKVGAVFRPVLLRPPHCAPLVYRLVPRSSGKHVVRVAIPEALRGGGSGSTPRSPPSPGGACLWGSARTCP